MHLHVVPQPGPEHERMALRQEAATLWAGLGAVLLEAETVGDADLYELHRKGERLATALSIVHDDLAKLAERMEP